MRITLSSLSLSVAYRWRSYYDDDDEDDDEDDEEHVGE